MRWKITSLSSLAVERSLKNWQMGKVYNDLDELVADAKVWIASKDCHFFAHRIDRLPHKWKAAIKADGDYSPEWSFDYVFYCFYDYLFK